MSRLTAVVALSALAACSGGDGGPIAPPGGGSVTSVAIEPGDVQLQLGETTQLSATGRTASGGTVTGNVSWSSDDPTVVSVDAQGLARGVSAGTTTIRATIEGRSAQAAATVQSFRMVDDVAVIDSTVLRLASDSSELAAGTYRFEVIGAPVPDLQPGQVIVGNQGVGFLRRAASVSTGGSEITVSTTPAGLEDLIEEGELGIEFDIFTGDFDLAPSISASRFPGPTGLEPPRVTVGPLMTRSIATGVSIDASAIDLSGFDVCAFFKNRGQPCPSIIDEFKLPKARADLTTSFDIGAMWSSGGLTEFHAIATGTLDTDVAVSLGAKVSYSYKPTPGTLAQVGRLIYIQLGSLPIVILVELELKGGFEASATVKGKLQAGITTNHSVDVGGRWTDAAGWQGVFDGQGSINVQQPAVSDTTASASIQLDAKVSLIPELHLYFYGIVGPFVSAGPFEQATMLASTHACYAELKAGVEAAVGVAANDFLGANKVFPPYSSKTTLGAASQRWDCPVGNVRVTTTTTGQDLDPDGYTVTVDGNAEGSIDVNDTVLFPDIRPGQRQIGLTGVAGNCTVTSTNPISGQVTVNSTLDVAFQIDCRKKTTSGRIAFTNGSDILSMNPDGTGIFNITNDGVGNDDPSWSPDYTKIAYVSMKSGAWNVWVRNADGSGTPTQLTFANTCCTSDAEYSPDGNTIMFMTSVFSGNGDIYTMPATGGAPTLIANDPKLDANGEWSPSGATIVFQSQKEKAFGGDWEIFTIPAGGGAYNRLTNTPDAENDPTYSPDGSKILFNWIRGGVDEIWVMDTSGGGQVMIGHGDEPTWSPDGTMIAFVSGGTIWTANADGSNLFNTGAAGEEPVWR